MIGEELGAVRAVARAASAGPFETRPLVARLCAAVAASLAFERVAVLRLLAGGELVALAAHGVDAAGRGRQGTLSDWPLLERAVEGTVFDCHVGASGSIPPQVVAELGLTSVAAAPLESGGSCIGFLLVDRGGALFALGAGELALLDDVGAVAGALLGQSLELEQSQRLGELKSHFVALASHELRTPVAAIFGIAATLQRRDGELSDELLATLRTTLYEQSDRMRLLVDQLLDLSRLDAGSIPVRLERLPVRRRVEELVEVVAGGEHRGEVAIEVPPDLETVVDGNAFDRIVTNLLVNAFRYGAPPIAVAAEQRDTHFRLTVEDRGDGVSKDFVPHLFERFARSDPRRQDGGSGLGLAIAQSYANAHGGELVYEAAEPRGARFQLVLPRQHEA